LELELKGINAIKFDETYTCAFTYPSAEEYSEEVDVVVRCKYILKSGYHFSVRFGGLGFPDQYRRGTSILDYPKLSLINSQWPE